MATVEKKRIINLAEKSAPENGDFFAVDSQAGGTKKIPTTALAKAADLTAEAAARTQADNALTSAINSASALIQNPTKTLSGALCSFTDGADMPMVACTAEIVPKQSGTGTPAPDNVRTISGWESVGVNVASGNLIDVSTNQSGVIDANGNEAENSVFNRTDFIPIDKAKIYIKTSAASGYAIRVHGYSSSKAWVQQLKLIATHGTELLVDETVPSNIAYVRLSYPVVGVDNTELWQGDTTTTPLDRTVYGGTLDVVSGVLTVDRAMVDLGSLNWTYDGTSYAYGYFTSSAIQSRKAGTLEDTICSNYAVNRGGRYSLGGANNQIASFNETNANAVCVRDDAYTDATAFKTAMNGVQLVYPLAQPQTYTLTPTEVNTLLGENNVWADSGDVEITYRRDISIVLENLENALNGSNSLNTMMMSAPTENTAEEPTEDEAEDDMR